MSVRISDSDSLFGCVKPLGNCADVVDGDTLAAMAFDRTRSAQDRGGAGGEVAVTTCSPCDRDCASIAAADSAEVFRDESSAEGASESLDVTDRTESLCVFLAWVELEGRIGIAGSIGAT